MFPLFTVIKLSFVCNAKLKPACLWDRELYYFFAFS